MDVTYISYTEETNMLDYLEKAAKYLIDTSSNNCDWKWVFISLHGALYAAALTVASGTDDSSVIENDGRVFGIWKALEECRKKGRIGSADLSNEDIRKFVKEFRGGFEHFAPGSWSIQSSELPRMVEAVFTLIEKLVDEENFFSLDPEDNKRLEIAMNTIRAWIKVSTH